MLIMDIAIGDNYAWGRRIVSLILKCCGFEVSNVTKMQDDLYAFDQNMEDLYYEATTMVVIMTIDTC